MLLMIVEHFKNNDALPVYRRFRDSGRLAPEGVQYIASWVDDKLEHCFQVAKHQFHPTRMEASPTRA
jgi:hypothetical protein